MSNESKPAPVSQPAAAILAEIQERRRSPMVLASGLGNVLTMLRDYVLNTEARIHQLEQRRP